jgi:hypothetical protein
LLSISARNKRAADNRMLVTFLWTKKDQPNIDLFRH